MVRVTFPKIGEKGNAKPIVRIETYFASRGIKPDYESSESIKAVLLYDPDIEEILLTRLKLKRIKSLENKIPKLLRAYISSDQKLIVALTTVGGPVTAIVIEALAYLGVRNIMLVGTAGGISRRVSLGDIVLCDKAIRDEGTSYHYLDNSLYSYPDPKLTQTIYKFLESNGIKFLKGTIWTTDGLYTETKEEVMSYRDIGALCVDMETATLFAVGEKRKIRTSAIFVISNVLTLSSWTSFINNPKNKYKVLADVCEAFSKAKI